LQDPKLVSTEALHRTAVVSTRQLSVPGRARREYAAAQKELGKPDITAAVEHLEKAVALAPQFSAAWNNLGTIAYHSHEYERAEAYFRKASEQDSSAYEPVVNLGGVLLTQGKLDEALNYNLYALLSRPNDALANAQLGMNYFAVGNLSLGQKYLEIAKRLDSAHFSYPQLTLAEIHLRLGQRDEAATEYEDFLKLHPDAPQAAAVRQKVAKLRR
jgi:Tfp pilus assembly protein PilF